MIGIKVGVIGGSGLDDPDIITNRKITTMTTPFGDPSDVVIEGEIKGVKCAMLARHGRAHNIMPSNVNYRANVWALKELGCTHLIVTTACGSLRENIKPGDFVVPDDFIDRTTKRHQTFYDGVQNSPEGVCHLPMTPAFCPALREALIVSAESLGFKVHKTGTVVTIEGPRFSSRAESNMFRAWGGDIINMTTCPEVVLAKEAGLLYGAYGLVTDYDCWREKYDVVSVTEVLKTFQLNVEKFKEILVNAIGDIGRFDWTESIVGLRNVLGDSVMRK